MFEYGFIFLYQKTEESELMREYGYVKTNKKDIEDACTVEMLKWLTKKNYYSGKLEKTFDW